MEIIIVTFVTLIAAACTLAVVARNYKESRKDPTSTESNDKEG
jgi:hypothetical protein